MRLRTRPGQKGSARLYTTRKAVMELASIDLSRQNVNRVPQDFAYSRMLHSLLY